MISETVTAEAPASAAPYAIERGALNYFYLQRMKVRNVPERLPYIRQLCAGRRVLHVGCTDFPVFNPAHNLHIQIAGHCARLDGLDTDAAGLKALSQFVQGTYYGDVSEIRDSYDLVLVPETIEHVHNIKEFLESLDRVSFAEVFITAPCLLGWIGCFNYADFPGWRRGHLSGQDDYLEEIHPDHKAWFTPYTLANCVEQFTPWRILDVVFLEGKRMVAVHCAKQDRP
ncbi:hypothetical protein [Methylobacterium sp. JK268]